MRSEQVVSLASDVDASLPARLDRTSGAGLFHSVPRSARALRSSSRATASRHLASMQATALQRHLSVLISFASMAFSFACASLSTPLNELAKG